MAAASGLSSARAGVVIMVAALGAAAAPVGATHFDGLVAYWPLNGDATDASGHGHHGTVVGGASFGAGKWGDALFCDDVDDRVTVPDDASFTLGSSPFTVAMYAQFASVLVGGSPGHPGSVLIAHDEGGGTTNKWMVSVSTSGLTFHINGPVPGAIFHTVAFGPSEATWHHIAFTRDAVNDWRVYIDGSLISGFTDAVVVPDPAALLTLCEGEGFYHWGGLDDVRLYNRALSENEIATLALDPPRPVPEMSTIVLTAVGALAVVGMVLLSRRR